MSKTNREQFEAWGMSDTDLRITLECETYAGIAWLAWQAATNEAEAKLTALTSQLESVVAELSAVDKIHNDAVFITDEHYAQCPPEVQKMIGALAVLQIPAYKAFLAEVRASGVEMFAEVTIKIGEEEDDEDIVYAGRQAVLFAAQLRHGGAV